MQQGSEVSHHQNQPPSETGLSLNMLRRQCVAVKEVSSLAQAMHLMTLYCIDQGHVDLDHIEALASTLNMLRRQVDTIAIDLASL